MKIRVKFKAIGLRGNLEQKTITLACPDFKEIAYEHTQKLKGMPVTIDLNTTINDQIFDWLDNLNKRYIMDDNDWQGIINYNIVPKKTSTKKGLRLKQNKNITFEMAKQLFGDNETLLNDFEVTYNRMADVIICMPIDKQFEIVFRTMNVGMDTAIVAYKRMTAILNGDSPDELSHTNKIISNL